MLEFGEVFSWLFLGKTAHELNRNHILCYQFYCSRFIFHLGGKCKTAPTELGGILCSIRSIQPRRNASMLSPKKRFAIFLRLYGNLEQMRKQINTLKNTTSM